MPAAFVLRYLGVSLALWKWDGLVVTGGTPDQFAAFAKRFADVDVQPSPTAMGRAFVQGGKPWVLWVEDAADVATLAHEALHIASGVLEARGLTHTAASEEAYTYTMEAILRTVLAAKPAQWCRVR